MLGGIIIISLMMCEALWASTLTIQTPETIQILSAVETTIEWPDNKTASCAVLSARLNYMKKQIEESESALKVLEKKARLTPEQISEYSALKARKLKLHRELARQKAIVYEVFDFNGITPEITRGIIDRQYMLDIDFPGLTWLGVDAAEPEGFSVRIDGTLFVTESTVLLIDYCNRGSDVNVRLRFNISPSDLTQDQS